MRSLAWASAFLLVAGRAALLLACASVSRAQTPSPAGPAFPVNTETYSTQADPDVAIDADGDFVVVWSSRFQDGASFGVFGQRFSSTGAPAGEEFPVNTTTADFEGESAVAMDASGSFVVVWQGEDDDNAGIDGQRFDPTGAPLGVEFQVNSCFDHSQESPGIAMETEGTFVAVWESETTCGRAGIVGRRFDSTGSALGEDFQVSDPGYAGYVQGPGVAIDAGSRFVVVWAQIGAGMLARRFDGAGTTLGAEFQVDEITYDLNNPAAVAANPAGDFVVVWDGYYLESSLDTDAFGQRYDDAGIPQGENFRIGASTDQREPDVALDAEGNFVVVWSDYDGLFGQGFDREGSPRGSVFPIRSQAAGFPRHPSIAMEPRGDFVVVWEEYGEADYDVFGRRFIPEPAHGWLRLAALGALFARAARRRCPADREAHSSSNR